MFGSRQRRYKKFYNQTAAFRHAEDDRMTPAERTAFDELLAKFAPGAGTDSIAAFENALKGAKLRWHYTTLRNYLDLILVVGAVAFGIRGLFFQPFRIPTSSMQPTLYGIHYQAETGSWRDRVPHILRPLLFAARRVRAAAPATGTIDTGSFCYKPGFFDSTGFLIGGEPVELPGDPVKVADYAMLDADKTYRRGEPLADGQLVLGDHLFVERFSLYWCEPQRGDVMVFITDGLCEPDGSPLSQSSGAYYIKRLAALPGDTIRFEKDQLWVRPRGGREFVPIQQLAPKFTKVYSGRGGYQGHCSGMGSGIYTAGEYTVPEDHYFMLGDNSRFSKDSRFFGGVPRGNLIGRAWIVFWPFSRRWGAVDRQEPLALPTGEPLRATFPVMWKQ